MLTLKATDTARDPAGAGARWFRCAGLIAVFVGAQLYVSQKYLQVGFLQAEARIHGRPFGRGSEANNSEEITQRAPGFPLPSPGRFASGVFQRDFENAAQKNFPGSDTTLMPCYRSLSTMLSSLSLRAIPGFAPTSKPLLAGYTLRRAADGERICGPPTVYHAADRAKLAQRASYYNDLPAAWPQVRVHVFPVLPVADWFVVAEACESDSWNCLAGDRYVREFHALLDPAVCYAWAGEGDSAEEVISCYYRTDHHWNFRGAYRAYRQLWGVLQERNPCLGPPWEPQRWIELPGLMFHGSAARSAGYCDACHDPIIDGVFDLPALRVRVHGFEQRPRNAKLQYQAGEYPKEIFALHYEGYFGLNYGLVEYTRADGGHGRLLVIGDSFDNSMEPLLAAHFSQAWFVDLRLYAKDVGAEFRMEDFLACHGITDVLFLGDQSWVLGLEPPGHRY